MPTAPTRSLPLLLGPALLSCALAGAQDGPPQFRTRQPMIRIGVVDAPGFGAAASNSGFGRLLADPEVEETMAAMSASFEQRIARWRHVLAAARETDLGLVQPDQIGTLEVLSSDWSTDLRSLELSAVAPLSEDDDERLPMPLTVLLIEPQPKREGRLSQQFEAVALELRKHPRLGASAEQKFAGYPAHVFDLKAEEQDALGSVLRPDGTWLLHLPGQFACGTGHPEQVGEIVEAPPRAPEAVFEIDVRQYTDLIMGQRPGGVDPDFVAFSDTVGLDALGVFGWYLRPAGEWLHSVLSVELREGELRGVLAALANGSAPLCDQPLPEGALLQLRLSFDLDQLAVVTDGLLAFAGLPSLADQGLREDLEKAWTGAVTIGVCAPQRGGVVPRLFASFGIADEAVATKLLRKLDDEPGLETKDVVYKGAACTQVRLPGLPAALQPTWHLRDGVVHWAESSRSMRDLCKAIADDRPVALDVGAVPIPEGDGRALPSFDLRYDSAAIYEAVHGVWEPLYAATMALREMGGRVDRPLVTSDDLPDAETVTQHLGPGRAVLRQGEDHLTLTARSPTGGPEVAGLLAAFPTMFSGSLLTGFEYSIDNVITQISQQRLQQLGDALVDFRAANDRVPRELAELIDSEHCALKYADLLLPGDERAEPILVRGEEVGRSSDRYYPDGLKVALQGEEVEAAMLEIRVFGFYRRVLDQDGVVHNAWMMGGESIEAIERQAADK